MRLTPRVWSILSILSITIVVFDAVLSLLRVIPGSIFWTLGAYSCVHARRLRYDPTFPPGKLTSK